MPLCLRRVTACSLWSPLQCKYVPSPPSLSFHKPSCPSARPCSQPVCPGSRKISPVVCMCSLWMKEAHLVKRFDANPLTLLVPLLPVFPETHCKETGPQNLQDLSRDRCSSALAGINSCPLYLRLLYQLGLLPAGCLVFLGWSCCHRYRGACCQCTPCRWCNSSSRCSDALGSREMTQ